MTKEITGRMLQAGQLVVRSYFPQGGSAATAAEEVYTRMRAARRRHTVPRKDLVAFVKDVATTAAGSNSDPDVMGRALDDIVAQAQGLLKRMAEG